MLLWWIVVGGVALSASLTVWQTERRREKDMELIFRGQQIAQAIQSYYEAAPNGQRSLPSSLADLLEDRRGMTVRHHLRQLWPDPITGSRQWGLVRQGPYIQGVYSTSSRQPLLGGGVYRRYRDWKFLSAAQAVPSGASSPVSPDEASSSPQSSSFDLS
jgi:type II secretory pathway pseudopilin PulG